MIRKRFYETYGIEQLWLNSLLDDHTITEIIKHLGLKIKFIPQCLVPTEEEMIWKQYLDFSGRQSMHIKYYAPQLYRASIFNFGLVFGFLGLAIWLAVTDPSRWVLSLLYALPFVSQPFLLLPLGPVVKWMLSYHKRSYRGIEPLTFVGAVIASFSFAWTVITLMTKDTMTWRGITYKIHGPFEIEIISPRKKILEDHLERYRYACSYVEGKKVLDVAWGTAYGDMLLKQRGKAEEVVTLDISGKEYESIPNAPYDVVTSFETIEHLENPEGFLKTLHQALKPGGELIISAPIRYISVASLQRLLEKTGFQVQASQIYPLKFSFKELMEERKLHRIFQFLMKGGMDLTSVILVAQKTALQEELLTEQLNIEEELVSRSWEPGIISIEENVTEERRKAPRFSIHTPAKYRFLSEGPLFEGQVENLSTLGIRLSTTQGLKVPVQKGVTVEIILKLPFGERELTLKGRVVWIKEEASDKVLQCGIVFESAREELTSLLAERFRN
ncbi:MAG: methyltransferase domain-containing protein [Candidatus Omnitrophica bacterium]|nr:methyltransferase domain-containing protein [Candidatus Omnitrophota bacterium]